MKKPGTEQKFNDDGLTIRIGTTDKKKPIVVYAEYGLFIEPRYNFDFQKSINLIKNRVYEIGSNIVSNGMFSKNIISIADVSIDRLSTNKKSFLNIQYYFRTIRNESYNDMMNSIKEGIFSQIDGLTTYIDSNGFSCSKTKR